MNEDISVQGKMHEQELSHEYDDENISLKACISLEKAVQWKTGELRRLANTSPANPGT